jgi:polysaccharide export outer membrane protein
MTGKLTFIYLIICYLTFILPNSVDAVEDQYKIRVNDVLDVKIIDHDELSSTAVVSADGTITLPYIGSVLVRGLTVTEIQDEVTRRLSEGIVRYPVVTVSLIKTEERYIYTYGQLLRRGEIPFIDGMTVMTALSLSGGVTADGLYGKLIVLRRDEASRQYRELFATQLNHGFIEDHKIKDAILKQDDMLIVENNSTFLIQGKVFKRGRYVLEKDMTVLTALLLAGGVSEKGLYGKITVRRRQNRDDQYSLVAESDIVDGKIASSEVVNFHIQPDDIITVDKNKTFLIEGAVIKRGEYVLEKGMTVLRALLRAGGPTTDGLYGKIKLRRMQGEDTYVYKVYAESRLIDGVIESKEFEDILVEPNDVLIVERNDTFLVYGEVVKRGQYVLQSDMTVLQAITIAGGLTKWGAANKVKILRHESGTNKTSLIRIDLNKVLEGDTSADIRLHSGDIIVVSEGIL